MSERAEEHNGEQPLDLIVFGGSGGIGQSLLQAFAGGHNALGTYLNHDPEQLVEGVRYHKVDVGDPDQVEAFAAEVCPGLRRPVLVYTPGISPNALAHKVKQEPWDRTLQINLTGAMYACRAFLPRMQELGWGRIVLVSSVLARTAVPGTISYSVTKAGLGAMARVIAVENARKGITANALALGYYSVGIIKAVPQAFLEKHVIPGIPQRRLGDPDNVVAAVRFLVEADYLTGATLDINGGIIGA